MRIQFETHVKVNHCFSQSLAYLITYSDSEISEKVLNKFEKKNSRSTVSSDEKFPPTLSSVPWISLIIEIMHVSDITYLLNFLRVSTESNCDSRVKYNQYPVLHELDLPALM